MNRPDLIQQLQELNPSGNERKINVLNMSDDTKLELLAPQMRLEILAMSKEIEELKEWISVDDRLPEIHCSVLVFSFNSIFDDVSLVSFDVDKKEFRDIIADLVMPTHWKNLPTPPKN